MIGPKRRKVEIRFKKLSEKAVVPKYAHQHDGAMDLTATSMKENFSAIDNKLGYIEYGTDLALEIPPGYVGLIFPRSSVSNTSMSLANAVGVVDSGYLGEIKIRMRYGAFNYKAGDRVAQLMIIERPCVTLVEVDDFEYTERGAGGFGSTGA